jgi:hypothetical protein
MGISQADTSWTTTIPTVVMADQGASDWDMGAYVYGVVTADDPFNASGYSSRTKITVQASEVAETLTDFPVYVDLSLLPAGFHAAVAADGGDIRVTRVSTGLELAREVVSYDAVADTGELHFLAPSLSSTTDTEFYIYAGNALVSDYAVDHEYGAQAVWSNGYVGVWHLTDATTSTVTDSTGTSAAGDKTAANQPPEATGIVGEAQDFSGESYQIDAKYNTQATYFTKSAFAKGTAAPTTGYTAPISRYEGGVLQWDHANADYRGVAQAKLGGYW